MIPPLPRVLSLEFEIASVCAIVGFRCPRQTIRHFCYIATIRYTKRERWNQAHSYRLYSPGAHFCRLTALSYLSAAAAVLALKYFIPYTLYTQSQLEVSTGHMHHSLGILNPYSILTPNPIYIHIETLHIYKEKIEEAITDPVWKFLSYCDVVEKPLEMILTK